MSKGSPIGWLNRPGFEAETANVVMGCIPRSTGCDNCFAPLSVVRQQHLPGRDGIVARDVEGRLTWTGKVITLPERLEPLARARKPRMVFVTVLGDLFDVHVDDEFLVQLWQTMRDTPQHIYIILSKLGKRMHDQVAKMVNLFGVLSNLWLGVSCENQQQADIRLPWLMRTPAAIRVGSFEPLLGPIDATRIPAGSRQQPDMVWDVLNKRRGVSGMWEAPLVHGLDWVIVGGESAPRRKARPMHPSWARDLIAQASTAGIATYFKQWGSWRPAPWVVRVPDEVLADPVALAAAKIEAEKTGATHYYNDLAYRYGWKIGTAAAKAWSSERHELSPGEPNAPIRYHAEKTHNDTIDGRTWHQWPVLGGGIVDDQQLEGAGHG